MKAPSLSIVMSVYNPNPQHLNRTIVSVLEQSLSDFEFIIIQDDGLAFTRAMLCEWQNKDARIKLIENRCNLGLIVSLNKGLDMARTSLIARIDVGDWWDKQKLEFQKMMFDKDASLVLCGTSRVFVDMNGKELAKELALVENESLSSTLLNAQNPFTHSSVMFRKNHLRYNTRALYCEDFDLWLRYSFLGRITNLSQEMTYYLMDETGITSTKRFLMIQNVTKIFSSFLKMIAQRDLVFFQKGVVIEPKKVLTSGQKKGDIWYSKAIYAAIMKKKYLQKYYLLRSVIANPCLIWEWMKRVMYSYRYMNVVLDRRSEKKIQETIQEHAWKP